MGQTTIHKINIPKSKLLAIPESERLFFVYAGHILNEVNWFNRLILILQQTGRDVAEKLPATLSLNDQASMDGNSTQLCIALRLFAGKLIEALKFLDRWGIGMPWFTELMKDMPKEGAAAFNYVSAYLKEDKEKRSESILRLVRDKFAFHYDERAVKQSADVSELVDEFVYYLTEKDGNSLYHGSELVVMSTFIGDKNSKDVIERLMDESLGLAKNLHGLFSHVLFLIAKKYIGSNLNELGLEAQFELEEMEMAELRLPFFVSLSNREA